ncbi:hypothetical protein MIND_00210800 [Mycena indigotica]|uniref:F-box domain-containing protein n=1 Tax=Mycena indigotica TaxID=2126181 RepID=A0A8H6T4L5_9AGAR|nr:uncharacterized protein MIND_00210800 [Mycena indigotica]KAF7311990.1 hypothetical protein MIND_00210800 [Mycena indigotica]
MSRKSRAAYTRILPASLPPLDQIPLDIVIFILQHCSPFDLAQLSLATKSFRRILTGHPSLWKHAQLQTSRGTCPLLPECPPESFTHEAYAAFIFGGGHCSHCSKLTNHLPFLSLFRFRSCSQQCKSALMSEERMFTDWGDINQTAFWSPWLPHFHSQVLGKTYRVYDRQAIALAWRELQDATAFTAGLARPFPNEFPARSTDELGLIHAKREQALASLTLNAQLVTEWAEHYLVEKRRMRETNLAFIKLVANCDNVSVRQVLECSGFQRIFAAFNRDLEKLTFTVWMEHRYAVLTEINGIRFGRQKALVDQVECPHCQQSFGVEALSVHTVAKHSDVDPDLLPIRPPFMMGKKHCRDCPKSDRVYTGQGLRAHQRAKHP